MREAKLIMEWTNRVGGIRMKSIKEIGTHRFFHSGSASIRPYCQNHQSNECWQRLGDTKFGAYVGTVETYRYDGEPWGCNIMRIGAV